MIRSSPFPLGRGFFMHKISRFAGATVRKPALPKSEKLLSCARTVFRQNKKRPPDFQQEFGGRFCLPVFTLRTMAGSRFPVALSPIFPYKTETHEKAFCIFRFAAKRRSANGSAAASTASLPSFRTGNFSGIQVRTALFGCKPSRQICCTQRYSSAFFRSEHTFFSIMPAAESITGFTLRAPCGHTETQRIQEIHAFASTCFGSA